MQFLDRIPWGLLIIACLTLGLAPFFIFGLAFEILPILTTIRLLYEWSSYYELTGLPDSQLSTQYFFPWYNSNTMSSELRVAVP